MAIYNGTSANDSLVGGFGDDTVSGAAGNDTLQGGNGNDLLDGGSGSDTARFRGLLADYDITWNAATRQYRLVDRLNGRDGIDLVQGVETFRFADVTVSYADLVDGAGDGLVLSGTTANDSMVGGIGYDSISGNAGNDTLSGFGADDTLLGGEGNDSLIGGAGDDSLAGGNGSDSARFAGSFASYEVTWDATARHYRLVDQVAGRDGTDVVSGVENFVFADGTRQYLSLVAGAGDGLVRTGTAANDLLLGDVGYDLVQGMDGHDVLEGRGSGDTLEGGNGNDTLTGGQGDDVVRGGAGTDTVRFTWNLADYQVSWDHVARGYRVMDLVSGREGTDLVSGVEYFQFAGMSRYYLELVAGAGDGLVLAGTASADSLSGGEGFDLLQGLDGSDVLAGYDRNDTLAGGNGDDQLAGMGGDDFLDGGAGEDMALYAGASTRYRFSWDGILRQLTITDLAGEDGVDVVTAVERFGFADRMLTAADLGAVDGVSLTGTEGNDTLLGSGSADSLRGQGGQDWLVGRGGADTLQGGDGDDRLEGESGDDRLDGGAGRDIAHYAFARAAYDITWDAGARQYRIAGTVPGAGEGIDTVSGVEYFWFAGSVHTIADLVAGMGDGWVLTGSAWGDSLVGDVGYDLLQGLDGSDRLVGRESDDTLEGGGGNDELVGEAGNDRLDGGTGHDTAYFTGSFSQYEVSWDAVTRRYTLTDLLGNDGTDETSGVESFVFLGDVRDWSNLVEGMGDGVVITDHTGWDALVGGTGYDLLQGLGGNDRLEGRGANDTLEGGDGDDLAVFAGSHAEYDVSWDAYLRRYTITDRLGRDGSDITTGVERFAFADGERDWSNLFAGAGDGVVLAGTGAADYLVGSVGHDRLSGLAGDDLLDGRAANDILEGGSGNDTAVYHGIFAQYIVQWDPTTRRYSVYDLDWQRDGHDFASGVENFAFADGTRDWSNLVAGTGDGFVLVGTAGSDTLTGGVGYDALQGQDGDDVLEGGAVDDTLEGGEGTDYARFSGAFAEYDIGWNAATRQYTVSDRTPGRDGTDLVRGVENFVFTDTVRGWSNLVPGAGDGLLLAGTEDGERMDGGAAFDLLQGLGGGDWLDGHGANDTLLGGDGTDMLEAGAGDDSLDGGADHDTVHFSGYRSQYGITWDPVARRYTVVDSIAGRDGTDVVGNVELFSFASGQQDWGNLVAGMGDGLQLAGTAGSDTLDGGVGYDSLRGLDGFDFLWGRDSGDTLDGGGDYDMLTGGAGADVFVLEIGAGADTIMDFVAGTDRIELRGPGFAGLGAGPLDAAAFQAGPWSDARDWGTRIVFDTGSGNLFYDPDGLGYQAATAIGSVNLYDLVGVVGAADFVVAG